MYSCAASLATFNPFTRAGDFVAWPAPRPSASGPSGRRCGAGLGRLATFDGVPASPGRAVHPPCPRLPAADPHDWRGTSEGRAHPRSAGRCCLMAGVQRFWCCMPCRPFYASPSGRRSRPVPRSRQGQSQLELGPRGDRFLLRFCKSVTLLRLRFTYGAAEYHFIFAHVNIQLYSILCS